MLVPWLYRDVYWDNYIKNNLKALRIISPKTGSNDNCETVKNHVNKKHLNLNDFSS
jgi:hypothetical protein